MRRLPESPEALQHRHHHLRVRLVPSLLRAVGRHQERQDEVHPVLVLTDGALGGEPSRIVIRAVPVERNEGVEREGVRRVPGVVHPVLAAGLLADERAEPLVGVAHVYDAHVLATVIAAAHVQVHEERLAGSGCSQDTGVVVGDELALKGRHLGVDGHRDVTVSVSEPEHPFPETLVIALPGGQAQGREQLHGHVVLAPQLRPCPGDGRIPEQRSIQLVVNRLHLHRREGRGD